MKKVLGYIFSPIHYLFFGFFLLLFHPIQWLSLKLGGYSGHKRSVDILNYFLTSTYYLMGTRAKFTNVHRLPEGRPILFIANHQSMYDIPPMIWHFRKYHAKFISKIELTKGIPSISFNLKYGGAANINRKDPKQSIGEILKLAQRMRDQNWSAVIFPEGTRSKNGEMRAFAVAGAATILKKVPEALVVPVAIKGAWKLVQHGAFPLSFGEKMSWTVLTPIEPAGRTPEAVLKEAEEAVKNEMADQMRKA
ncbi:lysophospholipid acyltransferase family protein [Filimonas effusa]|uniref:1-acyl-sn-glycerol-3-phosphate acyltransferase n=1 Tax=Filimonas effusa TaxID=2508721 RepID=A0A4Q1D9X4_9BACT|nr:lysophospholipid acyltransferase family protein [Filimonas effusa]RXK86174.1 1-acyl-sn-glycerol-3-phosphate acyltransferase [Filimonas effusa]